ncbi:MAG: diaminopimelate decarboxylase [Desulfobacterales bacterium]|nr:diaminopimelate decarboxylase [Desulfobacterales bacterium]
MNFYFNDNYLYCEKLKIKDIQEQVKESPFYLYSLKQIKENYEAYVSALDGINSMVFYALKANSNITIIKHLCNLGSGAVLVSGNELRLALAAGFDPRKIVFNGNGKTIKELIFAVQNGIMINIDSEFDFEHIQQAADKVEKPVDVLIRVNPEIDADVHPYLATGISNSKFGVRNDCLDWFLSKIRESELVNLVGVHCHLGTTIKKVEIFRDAALLMIEFFELIRQEGFDIKYLNIGGGLGIDYEKKNELPTQADLIASIREVLPDYITLIIEPGRSIVGNAGVLINRVVGVKTNGNKKFIVTDGSMAELIRPSLYEAYHHIDFIEPVGGDIKTYDIVGPICESADFLGKDRELPTPYEGTGIAVYDTGAYCYVMSSNYNIKMRPPEYLVDGDKLVQIRRSENFDDYMRLFDVDSIQ